MGNDIPPSDKEILTALEGTPGGLSPGALLEALGEAGHSLENTIIAIQRVFDRGLVELASGARLVVAHECGVAA